jgi:hypothetical protein
MFLMSQRRKKFEDDQQRNNNWNLMMLKRSVAPGATRVKIDYTVKEIPGTAFMEHRSLMEVSLPKFLRMIGPDAFRDCEALRQINIPESVTEIRERAFRGCSSLHCIQIPGGISKIREETFARSGLKTVAIPPTVLVIKSSAFAYCASLLSVELPMGLRKIGERAFESCEHLVNVEIPSSVTKIGDRAFERCERRLELRLGVNIEALDSRFGDLPIHNICYFQAQYAQAAKLKRLEKAILNDAAGWTRTRRGGGPFSCCMQNQAWEQPDDVTSRGSFVDPFGMTPLHILVLSARPSVQFCEMLLTNYPSNVLQQDKYGRSPMDYVCMANAPIAIVKLLLTSQETFFPNNSPNWKYFISMSNRYDSLELILFFVRSNINHRLDCLGLRAWTKDVSKMIRRIAELSHPESREEYIDQIYQKLLFYEGKEILSLLELALWKAKMDVELRTSGKTSNIVPAMSFDSATRRNCRFTSGAEIVIHNVLPFLAGGDQYIYYCK